MAAEYTAVGALFNDFLSTPAFVPIIVIGCITMLYTAVGGLYVSIVTDQWQSLFSIFLLTGTSIWVSFAFRPDLPQMQAYLAPTMNGYQSIFNYGVSLTASYMFSDAVTLLLTLGVAKSLVC